MSKVFYFEDYLPYIVQELICVKCLHRWIGVMPEGTLLKKLECPHCRKVGYVIATGQEIGEQHET